MRTTYIYMKKLKRYVETENDTLTFTCMCTYKHILIHIHMRSVGRFPHI